MLRNINILRSPLCYNNLKRKLSKKVEVDVNENEPIKFLSSAAAKKIPSPIFRKSTNDMPWYQPYSVVFSVSAFLLYFCVLREENDIDLEFDKTLYDRIKGLEKVQLLQSYKYNIENNLSVEEIEKRLREIEAAEAKESTELN